MTLVLLWSMSLIQTIPSNIRHSCHRVLFKSLKAFYLQFAVQNTPQSVFNSSPVNEVSTTNAPSGTSAPQMFHQIPSWGNGTWELSMICSAWSDLMGSSSESCTCRELLTDLLPFMGNGVGSQKDPKKKLQWLLQRRHFYPHVHQYGKP